MNYFKFFELHSSFLNPILTISFCILASESASSPVGLIIIIVVPVVIVLAVAVVTLLFKRRVS